jgi:hypothetical protein
MACGNHEYRLRDLRPGALAHLGSRCSVSDRTLGSHLTARSQHLLVGRTPRSGFQRSPLHRHRCRASTPGRRTCKRSSDLRLEVATLRACSALAVPPGFDGFRRIGTLRVYCTPQPIMGFVPFPASVDPFCEQLGSIGVVPGNATPFGAFPSTAAVPRHRGRCLLAVPRTASGVAGSLPNRKRSPWLAADLKALLHSRVRCCAWRFRQDAARCSHGLRPLWVSTDPPRWSPKRPPSNRRAFRVQRGISGQVGLDCGSRGAFSALRLEMRPVENRPHTPPFG